MDISLDVGSLDKMKITSSEPKYYLGRSVKGLITYMDLKTVRTSKRSKESRHANTNVILKDISKIIKEFEKVPYEGYVRKRSKYVPTDSYFYIARHPDKCMTRLNLHVVPVRIKMTNTQRMNNSEMSTQNIPNFRVCSTDKNK